MAVYGAGVCDTGRHPAYVKRVATRGYKLWQGVMERCYSEKLLLRRPSYAGCHASDGFRKFQSFMDWAEKQVGYDKQGWHLDKDLLFKGNKVYGEDTCVFIPGELNQLITGQQSRRGLYPQGVYATLGKFKAQISVQGYATHIGIYETPEEAFLAYKLKKEQLVREVAEKFKEVLDERAYKALLDYKIDSTD